jgi:ketosteroid isomerase-like protein
MPGADVAVVERIYAAMAERDIGALLDLIDPECVITQDERLPWGGRFAGHDGFAAFAAALTGAIESAVTAEALFEADGHVYQFGRTRGTAKASGRSFDIAEVHRWLVRDGRAVEAHFAIDTDAMLEALG